MRVVEVAEVAKEYSNKKINVCALNNINLSIEKGEFVAIVGPSGSGKSTLLHLLGGLEKPTKGSIKVNGKDLSKMKEKEIAEYRRIGVGFVFQKFNLIPMLNVEENIALPVLIGNESVDENYMNELITFLGLDSHRKHMSGELSGGQQQRVGIARALITKPSIILADEPTGNLDQKASGEVVDYLAELSKKYGYTVIMITHNLSLTEKADRVIKIMDGNICEEQIRE